MTRDLAQPQRCACFKDNMAGLAGKVTRLGKEVFRLARRPFAAVRLSRAKRRARVGKLCLQRAQGANRTVEDGDGLRKLAA
jgi:hypothetical protein